jgi:hypothetical protein
MKYLIVLILIIIGCVTSNTNQSEDVIKSVVGYDIVMISGHEYIMPNNGGIAHKINCAGLHP